MADSDRLQVMIHLDQGGRYFFIRDWFEKARKQGLMEFDLIGLSYYPFWHGTFADLKETLERLAADYGKPLMVVETAHAWRRGKEGFIDQEQERIAGIEASPRDREGCWNWWKIFWLPCPDTWVEAFITGNRYVCPGRGRRMGL